VFADVVGTREHDELVTNVQADIKLSKDKLELLKQQDRKVREELAKFYRPRYVLWTRHTPDDDDGSGFSDKDHAGLGRDRRRGAEGIVSAARAFSVEPNAGIFFGD